MSAAVDIGEKMPRPARIPLARRLAVARPSRSAVLLGSPLWAGAMTASAVVALIMRGFESALSLAAVACIVFAGALLAFTPSLYVARLFASGGRPETRFAAAFLCLAIGTIGITAFLYAMQFRLYYAQWHGPFPSVLWAFQFVFTSAGAVYQFAVMGTRLYLPLGLPALVLAGIWHARQTR